MLNVVICHLDAAGISKVFQSSSCQHRMGSSFFIRENVIVTLGKEVTGTLFTGPALC